MAMLAAVAFAAGFISSIAGSGGLLTLPALLSFGLPPMAALATNKVQSALGTLSSTWNFYRQGHLNLRELRPSMAAALVGSTAGTLLVQRLDEALLMRLLPVLLIAIAVYFVVSPRVSDRDAKARLARLPFALLVALPMGFYGGFFGPGMGSVLPFLFVWLQGYNLRRATAHTKVMVLAINATSAILFILGGRVLWDVALAMSVAQAIGARLGSDLVIRRGATLVQPIIVVVTLTVAVKLLLFP